MLNAVLALNDLDTHVFNSPEPGEAPRVYDSHVLVPDAHLLFNGEFKRVGTSDLKIVGDDGQSFFIADYFAADKRAALMSPEGATLSASVVEALAGPLAPGQLAQAGGQAASAQPVIGRVDAVGGSATVVRNGVSVALNVGDTVRKGDVVQTSGGSSVAIVFSDGTTFSLNANARMVLNEFVYAAGGTGNSAAISLVQGTFSFVAGQVAKTGDMRVETPVATMGIRGTAVLVEISATDGQTRFSVMVEPDGTTGSFNLYSKTTGALIGTVNNSAIGWVVTPAGPLQVVAQQVQKTPAELQQELGIVQQIFTIFNNNQQNPFVPQDNQERRGDNPNDNNPQTAGSSGSGESLTVTVPITTPGNTTPTIVTATITPVNTTTTVTTPTTTTTPDVTTPTPTPDIPTLNIIDFSTYVPPVPQINGTGGADQITGSNYDDIIDAGAGNDFVFASSGDDIIIAGHGEGDDFYDGGEAEHGDTITYTSANGVVFDLNSGTFNLGADGIVKSSTAYSSTTGTDVFVRVEKIVASPGNDIFILNDTADWEIDAGAGIDIVRLANGVDFPDSEDGPEISNWEIADLKTDQLQNIVSFEVGDFDDIGDEGVILDRAPLRILGGENDIIQVTNHAGTEGYWVLAGTFTDPAEDGTEDDPFNDGLTDGVTFNIYQFVDGEEIIGTVYVENGVQFTLPNEAPTAGNVTLEVNALGNGGFETTPDFDGWTINLETSDTTYTYYSSATIDRSGTLIEGDDAVAVLSFAAQVPYAYGTGYGPSITSDAFEGNAGDTFSFVYRLNSGGDQAIGSAYLRDENGNIVDTIFDYQTPFSGSTGVQTYTITLEHSGSFMLDFRVGSYDWTGGLYIGATLEIGYAGILQTGVSEDQSFVFAESNFLTNSSDADGDTLSLYSVAATSALGAIVYLNADGTVTYDPTTAAAIQALAAGETITDTFTFTVQDENGAVSNQATATVTVQGANDTPVLTGDLSAAVDYGASYQLTTDDLFFTDPDDAAANVAFTVTNPVNGVVMVGESIVTTFTAAQLAAGQVFFVHDGSQSVSASFDVSVEDHDEDNSEATVSTFNLTVNPSPNTAPDAQDDTISGSGSGPFDVALLTPTSSEAATVAAGLSALGQFGTITQITNLSSISAADLAQYEAVLTWSDYPYPNSSGLGDALADYVDLGGGLVIATYALSAPWWLQGRITTDGYAPLEPTTSLSTPSGSVVPVLPEDLIFDGVDLDSLSFFYNSNYAVPALDENAILLATDGNGVNVIARNQDGNIIAANIFPSFEGAQETDFWQLFANMLFDAGNVTLTNEDSTAIINASTLLANDTDPDGDTLSIVAVSALSASGANVTLNEDGTITYDPAGKFEYLAEGETATDSFTYTVSDGNGGTDTATVSFTISGVDDTSAAPVIHIEDAATYEKDGEGNTGTTLYGLTVTDDDATEEDEFHITVTAEYGTLSPADPLLTEADEDPDPQVMSFHATLADINGALAQGIVYTDPEYDGENSEIIDTVTLTVTDADNNSDSMNFIFSVFGDTGVDLTGSAGKDVMFSTGYNDTFTGAGGSDTFVFGDEGGYGSGQDIITDFTQGQDRIALYGYSEMSDITVTFVDNGRNTLIDLGEGSSVTLSGAITLTATDFIFHPSNVLVA